MARPLRRRAVPDKSGTWDIRLLSGHRRQSRAGGDRAMDRDRILLTLATGTGKTFIAFQIAWKLFQAAGT